MDPGVINPAQFRLHCRSGQHSNLTVYLFHSDVRKPGAIVVFFHGNGATLERDVRDRQLVPQQITDSGVNAVLLAPQLAVDAADSSAGKFWQPGGLKRFVAESTEHLARLTGDPRAAKPLQRPSLPRRRPLLPEVAARRGAITQAAGPYLAMHSYAADEALQPLGQYV